MSDCIYHDAPAVNICPSCDFHVCQECLDGGADGVCANCAEDNARRSAAAAAVEVERCKYCRIAADEETTLDHDGYCGTCAALPRCATHDDLIAFDSCKSCRQQFCRKCLGFNNVCEACTIKQKSAPPKPPKPATAGTGAVKSGTGAMKSGTGPIKKGTGPVKKGDGPPKPKRPRPPEAKGAPGKPGAKRKKGEPELDEKGRPKKKGPSRGTMAMEAKLQAKHGNDKRPMYIAAGVGALVVGSLLFGMFRPISAEEYGTRMRPQMVAVHKAVMAYYRKKNDLPPDAMALKEQLSQMNLPEAKGLKLKFCQAPDGPGQVIFTRKAEGFVVQATDAQGQLLAGDDGSPITLNQFYESGR